MKKNGTESFYSGMFPRRRGNCYAFALDKKSNANDTKLQPGNISGKRGDPSRSCGNLSALMAADSRAGNTRMKRLPATGKCPPGARKIAGVVDPGTDFHFYRRFDGATVRAPRTATVSSVAKARGVATSRVTKKSPGVFFVEGTVWAHKRGLATGGITRDAKGKAIRDPRKASRNYGELDYADFCGFWCVSKKAASKK